MRRLFALTFAIAGPAAIAASGPVQAERAPVDVQLKQARVEARAAKAERQRLEGLAAKAEDQASRLHMQQLAAAQAIAAAEAEISAADARAMILTARLEAERQNLAAQQAPVSSLLAGLALMARRPPLALLADSGSAEEFVKLRILLRATTPAIMARTAALSNRLERSNRLAQAALAARKDTVRSRDELVRRRKAFAELESKANALAESRGARALGAGDVALASGEELAALERRAEARALSTGMARSLAEFGPAPVPAASGRDPRLAPFDYRLPADSPVTDGLGSVSANGVRSRGITLSTRRGAPLVVPASGTIVFSGPFRDYDGVVIVDHGNGWKSVLVNAGSRLKKGQAVEIGEKLGIALGPVEVQLQKDGESVSPAIIAGSSAVLSNRRKGG
ncbi:MAG TPA: peptidoglycan DD-metalloendopeptidase family protein [Sphingomicrobium sp.]|nr:peptidoglycan DD-metalloendopeptidase family protein [Sphingomicrobium sp.]